LIANIVDGGKTPVLPADRLGKLGFKICLYPNVALYLGAYAIREGMRVLREQGTTAGLRDRMMTFAERQDVVGLTEADAYEAALLDRVRRLSVGMESA
jgi:2-methylisocitrate lyase-like PEP mutase family enzyme